MSFQIKPIALSLFLLGAVSLPSFADEVSSAQQMDRINARANQLEKEILAMQKEMHSLKAQLKQSKHSKIQFAENDAAPLPGHKSQATDATKTVGSESNYVPSLSAQALGIGAQTLPLDLDVPGQSFVSTGPYIGIPLSYSGGNLIINNPNINEDVILLNIRKKVKDRLTELGRPIEADHAHLLLSGIVEGQMIYKRPGSGPASSDIDLTSAGLDGYILGPSSWTSALISLAYDNDVGAQTGSFNNVSRSQNSRLFLNKAFIVIGDFSKTPIYGSIGQMYVPFGTYGTNMVSSPVTKLLGRIKERAFLVGYQQQSADALYASAYIFHGETYTGSTSRISNGGLNLGYRYGSGDYTGDFGAGLIGNIADSQGMQNTGNSPAFGGFGGTNGSGTEQISHRVPALNLHGLFNLGKSINFLAEYVGALNSFSMADMTMNAHGAKPQAVDAELTYTFSALGQPSSITAGAQKTKDALALDLPLERYSLVFNTSLWKDTLQSLELRHDIEYAAGDLASGSAVAAVPETGESDNAVIAQFDLYF